MTIEEAIKSRIDRFNRLWVKATGHSFEEEPEIFKKKEEEEKSIWQEKVDKHLSENGFNSLDEFYDSIIEEDGYYNWNGYEELHELIKAEPDYSSLYSYEKYVIDEAKRTVEFINTLESDWWRNNAPGKTFSDVENLLKEKGYKTDPAHSGNTFSTMMLFVDCLIRKPEYFQYMHGALTPLIGDEGYHDDRSDIPKE